MVLGDYMNMNFDWVKPENFSLDWLQGHITIDCISDLFRELSSIGFDADSFVYWVGFKTRFYRDTFSYAPVNGDIRFHYNSKEMQYVPMNYHYFWTDGHMNDHLISYHSEKALTDYRTDMYVPSLFVTDEDNLNQHIYISVSGDGLRYLRSNNLYIPFLKLLYKFKFHCTRLDIALDIFDKDNQIVSLIDQAFSFVENESDIIVSSRMRMRQNRRLYVNLPYDDFSSFTLSFGNHGSNSGMFRLYDKLHEMRYGRSWRVTVDEVKDYDYWYRYEMEAHNDFAAAIFNSIVSDWDFNLAPGFVSISKCLFTVRNANWSDSHVDRWEHNEIYVAFLTHIIQNITFCIPKKEYRYKSAASWRKYVLNMCKVFFAINKCLSNEYINDISDFIITGCNSYGDDIGLKLKVSSFKDYYLQVGADLFYKDKDLISRCEAFNLKDVS